MVNKFESDEGYSSGRRSWGRWWLFSVSTGSNERAATIRWLFTASFVLLSLALISPLPAAQDESKILREAATKFWEARVKGDWATVYDYLSEAERAGRTKERYVEVSSTVGPWRYLNYKLGGVETSDDTGWVEIEYSAEPVQFPGIKPKLVARWEHWEKVDGRWEVVYGKRVMDFPTRPPSQRSVEEERAVTARAEKFWKAQEKGDYTTVYELCSPSFRKALSLDEWLTKKAQNIYVSHEIMWAEVQGDQALVRVAFEYRPNDPTVSKMVPLDEIAMQNWMKVDGLWYLDVTASE